MEFKEIFHSGNRLKYCMALKKYLGPKKHHNFKSSSWNSYIDNSQLYLLIEESPNGDIKPPMSNFKCLY